MKSPERLESENKELIEISDALLDYAISVTAATGYPLPPTVNFINIARLLVNIKGR